jgi:hypothetical protein
VNQGHIASRQSETHGLLLGIIELGVKDRLVWLIGLAIGLDQLGELGLTLAQQDVTQFRQAFPTGQSCPLQGRLLSLHPHLVTGETQTPRFVFGPLIRTVPKGHPQESLRPLTHHTSVLANPFRPFGGVGRENDGAAHPQACPGQGTAFAFGQL